ncbi:MAG: hypothetical protein HY236_14770, partial [Acidobacteria bacterium]|nr:hypothetical protein [Acidobacteriota bacterium]
MNRHELITKAIYDAIGEVNGMLEPEQALEKSPDTILFGESGKLDSLAIVNLMIAVEEKIERIFSRTVSLMDAVIAAENARWTVAALANYIEERVELVGVGR